ncbi:MAG: tetratricopeptide repeat protein [Nitrosospira sp.]|nr:tetratricopeptide repeat protein [Nitrosospira sp.]
MFTLTYDSMRHNITLALRRWLTAAGTCCLLGAGIATAAPIDDGIAAYLKGNHKQALAIWEPLAAQGNAEAQYWLGSIYFNGQGGMLQDYKVAMKWVHQAATQGHAGAQFTLGHMYAAGEGAEQDYQEAVKWFRLAAAQGHEAARKILKDPKMVEAAKSLDPPPAQPE